jgi:predicted O-methyltransferase YrrM
VQQFNLYDNVTIDYGDFYDVYKKYNDKSIDILHIDIANNGDVYEYMFKNYINKVKDDGIILMEGGSNQRDHVEWMTKYNKPKIKPVLDKYMTNFDIKTIGGLPSLTIIKKT